MSKLMNRPPPNILPPTQSAVGAPLNSQTFVEKILVGLDHAPQQFDLRGQLIGAGGANLHYIRNETGAIATLRGRGSMFIELALGTESPEPLHLYIEHPRYDGLQSAKQLAKNLIETLQQELVLYHQLHPPSTVQTGIPPQASQLGITPTLSASQMSVPPPMVAQPPPTIIPPTQPNVFEEQQQHHYITQTTTPIIHNSQIPPPRHPTILQQQSVIPHQSVPIHLNPGNMIIQQQITPVPAISNIHVPPPNLQMKPTTTMLHLQGPPPNQIQLTQPPPNIQLQPATQTTNTQILLNQPPQPSYQYQYIQQTPADPNIQNQITVQHIYQHQPPIQGIVQQQPPNTLLAQQQFNPFAQPAQIQRQAQHLQAAAAAPQYFVQGTNAYLVPPPNILQGQAVPSNQQPNIIFQTHHPPPQQIQMQSLQQHQIQTTIQEINPDMVNNEEQQQITKEEPTENPGDENNSPTSDGQTTNTTTTDSKGNEISDNKLNFSSSDREETSALQQPQQQQQSQSVHHPSLDASTQIMTVPPPITCIQHIVGNTLITTTANQTQPQKNFNQIPVSIQQQQHQQHPPQQQQIHVSTANGQHFLVQAQQWTPAATQFQPVSQPANIQGFQFTKTDQQITNDTQNSQQLQQQDQQILTTPFNSHQLQSAPAGMQLQFQQIHPAGQSQQQQHQLIQPIAAGSAVAHLIEQPPPNMQSNQMHIHSYLPPTFSVTSLPPPTPLLDSQPRLQFHQKPPQTPYPMFKTNIVDTQLRIGQKRKLDEDAMAAQQQQQQQRAISRTGIGNHSNAASITTTTQIATTTSSTASHMSSSNVQDESNQGSDSYQSIDQSNNNSSNYDIEPPNKLPALMHATTLPPPNAPHRAAFNTSESSSSSSSSAYGPDASQQRHQFDGPPISSANRYVPPRYRQPSTHRGEFSYPMRPPPPPMNLSDSSFPMHRINFRPPPPPPYGPPPPPGSHFPQW